MDFQDIVRKDEGENSARIRERVIRARKRQWQRFKKRRINCNAQMGNREVKQYCSVDEEGRKLLEMAVNRLGFSARAYTRALKVARTIADLEGEEKIRAIHVSEAIHYRMMDRYF